MTITKQQEEQIIHFGVFQYDAQKIASLLGCDLKDVQSELQSQGSLLNRLLQKGKDMADYVIDLKLFEMAKNGDLKALEKLEFRKKVRK